MRLITAAVAPMVLVGAGVAAPSIAHANSANEDSDVAAMRYVSLDVHGDDANSRQYSGTGSLTLGKHAWLNGTLGKLNDDSSGSLGDLKHFGIGAGFKHKALQLTLDFTQYKNDASYKQNDVNASLDFIQPRFSIGLDVMHRTTDNSIDSTRSFPLLGTVAYRADEQLTGNGFGLHADFNLTDALSLSLGGMNYTYSSDYSLSSSTNPLLFRRLLTKYPTLSKVVYLNNSGVTRSLALLDNSYNLGLSYQFTIASLTAQYLRDKALDTGAITDTVIVSAAILLGDAWMLSPSLGQSKAEDADKVTFGGLSLSYNF